MSLCSPSCPGTHSVDQADLELSDPPAFASQVLGLKAFTISPGTSRHYVISATRAFFLLSFLSQCWHLSLFKPALSFCLKNKLNFFFPHAAVQRSFLGNAKGLGATECWKKSPQAVLPRATLTCLPYVC